MTSPSSLTRQRSGLLPTPFHLTNNITREIVQDYLAHFTDIFWDTNKLYSRNPKKEIGYFNKKKKCMYLHETCPRYKDIKKILTNLQAHPKTEVSGNSKKAKLNHLTATNAPPKPVSASPIDIPLSRNLFNPVDLNNFASDPSASKDPSKYSEGSSTNSSLTPFRQQSSKVSSKNSDWTISDSEIYQIQKIHLSRKKRTKAKARAKTRMLPVLQKNQAKT